MTAPIEPFSPFLPTTYNIPEEKDRLDSFLNEELSRFSDVINDKKIGLYIQAAEALNGEKWVYNVNKVRNGYQSMAYISSYPNNSTLTLTLTSNPAFPITNINPQFVISEVRGTASKPCSSTGAGDGDYFSFFGSGNAKISFTMSDTTIVITTTVDMRAYSGFIIIEYIRDGV